MDSKIRRLTILVVFLFLILTFLVVLLINGQTDIEGTVPVRTDETEQTSSGAIYQNGQIGNDLSAFLRDDTFFDEEKNEYLDNLLDNQNRLSMIVTSIEKDLRIQIVDNNNEPVRGQSFYVILEGIGEYKDLDQDGIIYIGDLDSGEYEVSLKPMDGYRVPTTPTKVRVKDKVEYLVIDDISVLIKSEADIDASLDDTAEEIDDADKTEIRRAQAVSGKSSLGIDVSKWQKEIDWDKVKSAGVDFAIIRCGYRGSVTGSLVEDPYFLQNIRGATSAGIKVGVYFFTQAINEVEAVEEASTVVSLIRDFDLDYPVYIDTEGAGGNGRADKLDLETRTAVCEAFCSTIENAGYEAGIYASRNWFYQKLDTVSLEKYVIWLAEYRSVPMYQGYYQMWQYTSKGSIDGIKGNVDMNISYLGY